MSDGAEESGLAETVAGRAPPADAAAAHDLPTVADATPAPSSSRGPEAVPTRLGPYVIERELARGGMGAVHVARHVTLDRRVALKVLLAEVDGPSGEGALRFAREARLLAGLRHPGVVTLHEAGEEGGRRWMALELVSGGSLQDRLEREGPLEPTEAVTIVVAVADALSAAHAQGVLHRDLKPGNVLVDERGAPKLTDFGIAKPLDARSRLTATGTVIGTPSYAPPEQCGGDAPVDARADVYGLGATLYALLAGRPPFVGGFAQVVTDLLRRDPRPPSTYRPGVPEPLERIVLRCLEKDPAARYPTVAALRQELGRWLRGEPLHVQPPTLAQRLRRWRRRRPAALLAGAAAALLAPLLGGLALVARSRPVDGPEAVEVTWAEPLDGFVTRAGVAELGVDVRGAFDWLELSTQVGDQPRGAPRRVRSAERVTLVVPLALGENAVTLRVRSASGDERVVGTRRLRSHPYPDWYGELKEGARPPLPLPDGVEFSQAWGVYVNRTDGSELVWVPAGRTFTFGKRLAGLVDTSRWVEDSPRETTLTRGFFLGRTEVTWARWDAFCAAKDRPRLRREIHKQVTVSSGHEFESRHDPLSPPFVPGVDHPVYFVSWDDAQAYCAWAGLRLPTEAEWEWAASGPEGLGRPWGNEPPAKGDCNCLVDRDGYTHTAPVAAHPRDLSWAGCFDLAANVSEWCEDAWGPIAPEPATDPVRRSGGNDRVARGAPWYYPPAVVACTYRFPQGRRARGYHIGFRVAR